jgi:hypothetical protein
MANLQTIPRRGSNGASSRLVAAAALMLPSMLTATVAAAAGESITLVVDQSNEIGPFEDKSFREITGRLEGEAPGGPYSVPVTLVLPVSPEDHSGFALVDVVNTITIGDED